MDSGGLRVVGSAFANANANANTGILRFAQDDDFEGGGWKGVLEEVCWKGCFEGGAGRGLLEGRFEVVC
jgi:hypothetical protein